MGTIGPRLRAAREARNLSVEQAAEDTRISLRFLQALEREEFDALPAPVYVRGFLRSYSNYLGLEPQSLLDELEGAEAGVQPAARHVRGPARKQERERPAAAAAPPPAPVVAPVTPIRGAEGEWDPEPGEEGWEGQYEEQPSDYRAGPVPGVLVERAYSDDGPGAPRAVMLIGIGLIVVLIVVVAAAFALGGDDDGGIQAGGGDGEPTATVEGGSNGAGGRTVIPVNTETPENGDETPGSETPTPGTDGTPSAGETVEATAEPTEGGVTEDTPAPATATPTPVPTNTPAPTATPTFTPQPTATPTELPMQPVEYSDCQTLPTGQIDCGPAPYLVVCGPRGWFVDAGRDFLVPDGWPTFEVDRVGEASSVCP